VTLPTEKQKIEPTPDQPYGDIPRDEIFKTIEHHLPVLAEHSKELKNKLVDIILRDMAVDHALAQAVDEAGKVLEYQAQEEGIEKPRFNGTGLFRDVERVSKLGFALNLCAVLGLDDLSTEAVQHAEISRLWGEHREKKDTTPTLKLPDEFYSILRDFSKSLARRGNGTSGNTTSRTAERQQRFSASTNQKTHPQAKK